MSKRNDFRGRAYKRSGGNVHMNPEIQARRYLQHLGTRIRVSDSEQVSGRRPGWESEEGRSPMPVKYICIKCAKNPISAKSHDNGDKVCKVCKSRKLPSVAPKR